MTGIAHTLLGILPFLGVVSVVIMVHEMGHYIVARCFRIRVAAVSLGFGRELAGYTTPGGTRWKLSLLPVGGYVRLSSQEASTASGDGLRLFDTTPLAVRALFMAAGPAASFALAILLFALVFTTKGERFRVAEITRVDAGTPAAAAGIKPGDHFLSINGHEVENFDDVEAWIMRHPGDPLTVVLQRGQEQKTVVVTPHVVTVPGRDKRLEYDVRIGITTDIKGRFVALPPVQAARAGLMAVIGEARDSLLSMRQLLEGKRPADQMSGSVAIAKTAASAASLGVFSLAWFTASLSAGIGIVNLLPIVPLDGGNLMLYAMEAVLRRPLTGQAVSRLMFGGMTVLAFVFVWGLRNDLAHALARHAL